MPKKHKTQKAWKLLLGNDTYIKSFPSRSEADCSLIVSLVNTNHTRDEIFQLFNTYPCSGKFQEIFQKNQKAAEQYLEKTYDNAYQWAKTNLSEGREIALRAKKWALQNPWIGRSGVYDRAVFLAHTDIAYQCGKVEYGASGRQLAELVPTICLLYTSRCV